MASRSLLPNLGPLLFRFDCADAQSRLLLISLRSRMDTHVLGASTAELLRNRDQWDWPSYSLPCSASAVIWFGLPGRRVKRMARCVRDWRSTGNPRELSYSENVE